MPDLAQFDHAGHWHMGPHLWQQEPPPAEIPDATEAEASTPEFKARIRKFDALTAAQDKRVRKGCRCAYCTAAKANRL